MPNIVASLGSPEQVPSAQTSPGKGTTSVAGSGVVHGWLREQVEEGDRLNRADPTYDIVDRCQRFVGGDQRSAQELREQALTYLPRVRFNESRRAVQAHVATLTDLKALFQFTTSNKHFQPQAQLITQRVIAWYMQTMADLQLADVIINAVSTGTGDVSIDYDPSAPGGGDTILQARDFRDTLPFRPGLNKDPQLWQGVTLREEHAVNALRAKYPTKAGLFVPSTDSMLASYMGRFRTAFARVVSPAGGTLSGLRDSAHTSTGRSGTCLFYRTTINDYTRNLTHDTIPMGTPGAAWAYTVKPGDRLYPYKRLLLWTEKGLVYDGPATYFHGMFPIARFQPWQVPWQFLGIPLLNDSIPINEAINLVGQDILLTFRKTTNPPLQFDRNQVSEALMSMYDARKPGVRVKTNGGLGDGIKPIQQHDLPTWTLQFLELLFAKHESLTGTANLQALLQARQLPSGDTLQKYFEAMTPEIRMEGRRFEAFLRPIAEMLKVNIFQYESTAKRLTILGEGGLALQDFDFDPGTLVPAMVPSDAGYLPAFDRSQARGDRAQALWGLIQFVVSPNSLLAINAAEQKMIKLQLARMGYYDFWSLMEALEVPNVGVPPKIPLPVLEPPAPEEVMQDMQAGLMGQPTKYQVGPMGELLEMREPTTITERLMAQQLLGIGQTANPAGRKASGGSEPQMEQKTDAEGAPRQTVTESSASRNE